MVLASKQETINSNSPVTAASVLYPYIQNRHTTDGTSRYYGAGPMELGNLEEDFHEEDTTDDFHLPEISEGLH
jgi:hypothetical protein